MGQRGIKVEWTAVPGAFTYAIDRDTDPSDGVALFQNVGTVQAPGLSRTFTDLSLGEAVNYTYRVRVLPQSGPALATAMVPAIGDLATSINTMLDTPLDDSLDNMPRVMATTMRGDQHVLAVGMPGANQATGIVRIYERPIAGGAWVQVQSPLLKTSAALGDHFGASVSLSPNGLYLAVGIPGDDRPTQGMGINPDLNPGMDQVENSGAVEVFRYNGTAWVSHAWFKALNAGADDAFGTAVAIGDEGHLFVGAPNEDSMAVTGVHLPTDTNESVFGDNPDLAKDRGAVYVYVKGASEYSFGGFIKPPTTGGGTSLYFGASIAMDALARRVAVGAPHASYNGPHAGGVVIYELTPSTAPPPLPPSMIFIWSLKGAFGPGGERADLASDNAGPLSAAYQGLGGSLSMSQDGAWLAAGYAHRSGMLTLAGGTVVSLPSKAGQAVLYRNQGGAWAQHSVLVAPEPAIGDQFAASVSLVNAATCFTCGNGLRLLVGARGDSSGHNGLMRASDIVPEGFVTMQESGAAYYFAGDTDLSQPMVLKARLKSPDRVPSQFLGRATAITGDGNELLLSGDYKPNTPASQAVFLGY